VFDPKTEPKEFVGADRAEAVAAACRFFGVEESELTIAEPERESVAGLAARTLIVAAPPESMRAPRRSDDDDRGGRGRDRDDRGGRGRGRDRDDRGGRGRGRDDRGDRGRDRDDRGGRGRGRDDRGDRGRDRDDRGARGRGRNDRGDRGRDRNDRGNRGNRDDRGGRDRDRGEERAAAAPLAIDEPSEARVEGELGELGGFVRGVVERMKVGRFGISEEEEDGIVVVRLTGNAAMRLSTAETRVGDAIQLLANQVAIKGGLDGPRVVVDIEGDRQRRDAFLEQLAGRAADRATSTGEAVALDPMNGKDRRTIHVALRDEDGIATMSVGEGAYRQVVVVPEGAEEYEDALRRSEEAARTDED